MATSRSNRKLLNTTDIEASKPLSLVQQRARQFEALATLETKTKGCNWWLSDFQNLKDNSCECEPCESLISIEEGDPDSEKFVIDEENNDVQDDCIEEHVLDDEPNDVAKESTKEDETMFTDDNDDDISADTQLGAIVEATNNNVNFIDTTSLKHHSINLVHSNNEETHATDEE